MDVAEPGLDYAAGAGRVRAAAVPEASCGCVAAQSSPSEAIGLLALLLAVRRRVRACAGLGLLAGCGGVPVEGYWVELHGRLVGEDGLPLGGAEVSLATSEGMQIASVGTSTEGEWRAPIYGDALEGNVLVALFRADGYAEGRATLEINLRSPSIVALEAGPGQTWDVTSRQVATMRLAEDAELATVTGRVVDALSGEPVEGVPLSLQVGSNAPVGDAAVGATESDAVGAFAFSVTRPGLYTVTAAEGPGTGPARFPAFLSARGGVALGVVGPPVLAGQLRATLVWAESPSDLDMHLSAPLKGGIAGTDGTGQYHIWSGAPTHPARSEGEEREAWFDRQDADGEGPESVWIDSLAEEGEVRLSIFDADNRSDADSAALGGSDAVLQVWFSEDTPRYYSASPGEIGTLWRPVEMDVASFVSYQVEAWSFGADPTDPGAF